MFNSVLLCERCKEGHYIFTTSHTDPHPEDNVIPLVCDKCENIVSLTHLMHITKRRTVEIKRMREDK